MTWQRNPDPSDRKRLFNVKFNQDGSPIKLVGKDGLNNKERKRKEKEILKGYTRREIRELKERARIEAKKQFDEKMEKIKAEVKEEIRQEDEAEKIKNTTVGHVPLEAPDGAS